LQDLHWDSLIVLKDHLYRQLITPLSQVSGCLETAQRADSADTLKEQVRRAVQGVKMALNTVKTWTALIEVKNGGTLARRLVPADGLPQWLVDYLGAQTAFQAAHTQPVLVNAETFYTSLILTCQIGGRIGTLKSLATSDSRDGRGGIWVRAVFDPPPSGPYRGMHGLLTRLDAKNGDEPGAANQVQLLQLLLEINGGSLKVQNNIHTGEQALAARLPAVPTAVPGAPPATASTAAPAAQPQAPAKLAEAPQTGAARPVGEPEAKFAEPEPVKDGQAGTESKAESTDKLPEHPAPVAGTDPTQTGAGDVENASETLIIPPPGLHERLAASHPEAKPTLAQTGDADEAPETLIVPPPSLHERLAASRPEARPALAQTGDADDAPETLVLPPLGLHERLAALADAESKPGETPEALTPAAAPDQPAESSAVEVAAHDEADRGSTPPPAAASDDQASAAPEPEQPAKQD
jgi:hypothetical protein